MTKSTVFSFPTSVCDSCLSVHDRVNIVHTLKISCEPPDLAGFSGAAQFWWGRVGYFFFSNGILHQKYILSYLFTISWNVALKKFVLTSMVILSPCRIWMKWTSVLFTVGYMLYLLIYLCCVCLSSLFDEFSSEYCTALRSMHVCLWSQKKSRAFCV